MTRPDCAALLARVPSYRCNLTSRAAPELHAALAATLEREAVLLRRVEELELMGCSLHKAAAAGRDAERAAVLRYLASDALLQRWRDSVGGSRLHEIGIEAIKAGAHRSGE